MMKYKVGDKVRIRKDLLEGNKYGENKLYCNSDMARKAGEVVTIRDVFDCFYIYKIENDKWEWCNEMFEELAEEVPSPEKPVKLYTWQDLCDYEILLHEKWRIVNEQRQEQYAGHETVMQALRGEYLDAIQRTIGKLGKDVPEDKAKEIMGGKVIEVQKEDR